MTSGSRFTKPVVTYTRNTNLTIRCGTTLLILVKTPGRESDGIPDTRKLAAKQRYRERLTFVWYWGTRGAACGTGEHVVQLVVLGNTWCSLWYWGTRGAACGIKSCACLLLTGIHEARWSQVHSNRSDLLLLICK